MGRTYRLWKVEGEKASTVYGSINKTGKEGFRRVWMRAKRAT